MYTIFVFVFTMLMCAQQFTVGIAAVANNSDMYLWASRQFFWINDVMLVIQLPILLLYFVLLYDKHLMSRIINKNSSN
ncbi:hypothetical protein V3C99_006853 [Haemonchus contortus]